MNRSLVLAEELIAISTGDLQIRDVEQLRLLLLDALGLAAASVRQPAILGLSRWAQRFQSSGRAAVFGRQLRVSPSIAALVNGTMIHCYELDDTHIGSISHPGSVVIAAALAVGAQTNASGGDILASIVAGYEAMGRIGMASNAIDVLHRGYHPTAIFGGFGAATAAAKLMGLDATGLLVAWGHVLSLTSGSMQFAEERVGTEVKRLHAGYPAKNGVMAAEIAQCGISAPHRPLDGKHGFFALYARNAKPELLARGSRLVIHDMSLKPYACCRLFHSAIDGLRSTTDDLTASTASIRAIRIGGPALLRDHMSKRPGSSMAAQYSLPYVIGATLEYGPGGFEAYDETHLAEDRILRWGELVECHVDDEFDGAFPAHMGSSVEVVYMDGARRTERILDSLGSPSRPLSEAAVRDKISGLARTTGASVDLARLETAIDGLIAGDGLAPLDQAMG